MKNFFALVTFFALLVSCSEAGEMNVLTEGILYSESVLPYNNGLLISNFGSDNRAPREDENKGYVLFYRDGKMTTVIPPDGKLHLPTGMAVKDNYLFIGNFDELIIYNMTDLKSSPRSIKFNDGDIPVNGLAVHDEYLYLSVTSSGRIYRLDISNPKELGQPEVWLDNVPGPNGLVIAGNMMYIASIPTDYHTVKDENVIYKVPDINQPVLEKFIEKSGLYDGVALSHDNKTLYVSDWNIESVIAINTETKESHTVYHEKGTGLADIAVGNGMLYVPDLLNSRVLVIPIN